MTEKNNGNWLKTMAWGSTIATSLAGLVVGGFLLGNYLDRLWGTDPWLKIVFMLLGVLLGIGYMILTLSKIGRVRDEKDEQ